MDESEQAIRRAARKRSTLLPGAGLALLGYPVPAVLGVAGMVIFLAAVAVVCVYPNAVMTWLAFAFLVGSALFWGAEYLAVGRITIRPSGEFSPITRHFKGVCVIVYSGLLAAMVCLLLNFGTLELRGDGMNPTVFAGERILYHKKVAAADLFRGRIIAFRTSARSSWGVPGQIVIGRILAVPGDAIATTGARYQVNGKESVELSPVGAFRVVLDIPETPEQTIVPSDSFFIVQEQPSKALDSRTLSWAKREDIYATNLWLLSRRALGQALK
jgi:signal peptidase I